ncbi:MULTISPECIES: hypothetical protein [Francisella]|uniref:Uncharacterized protein n=1 Tax=Francisella opportunistica TaxID=2016517 RepID=A0A345JPY4_9GAMM|nr:MULTISPECIES: hypothetical protein [Francisella]APC91065.1 hypothetical protein BBG19_0327 [Francisella sp. MA067296]AXH29380.1 hypothetical protein CGC43_01650 [Francisella opportunistica]AXH31031.1 hypothetical protein CGC44_01630 [Francisella opportunistica]AXH32678.1 hypothetical protein CGC45_01630 [Francisella opportunistica]
MKRPILFPIEVNNNIKTNNFISLTDEPKKENINIQSYSEKINYILRILLKISDFKFAIGGSYAYSLRFNDFNPLPNDIDIFFISIEQSTPFFNTLKNCIKNHIKETYLEEPFSLIETNTGAKFDFLKSKQQLNIDFVSMERLMKFSKKQTSFFKDHYVDIIDGIPLLSLDDMLLLYELRKTERPSDILRIENIYKTKFNQQ